MWGVARGEQAGGVLDRWAEMSGGWVVGGGGLDWAGRVVECRRRAVRGDVPCEVRLAGA